MAAPLLVNASYVGTIPGLPRVANKKTEKTKTPLKIETVVAK